MHTAQLEANPGTILTLRQVQILFYLAIGKSLEEIAIILGIARSTVKNHVELLYAKLHAENRAQLITHAFLQGFLYASKRATSQAAAALLLIIISLTNSAMSVTDLDDQTRNFRQARRQQLRRRDPLNPSLWDVDYA